MATAAARITSSMTNSSNNNNSVAGAGSGGGGGAGAGRAGAPPVISRSRTGGSAASTGSNNSARPLYPIRRAEFAAYGTGSQVNSPALSAAEMAAGYMSPLPVLALQDLSVMGVALALIGKLYGNKAFGLDERGILKELTLDCNEIIAAAVEVYLMDEDEKEFIHTMRRLAALHLPARAADTVADMDDLKVLADIEDQETDPAAVRQAVIDIAAATGLSSVPVHSFMTAVSAFAADTGAVTADQFLSAVRHFLPHDEEGNEEATLRSQYESACRKLFSILDTDHSGTVDMNELISGASILCGGSHTDKVQAMFTLFDSDKNGSISRSELVAGLTSIFTVMLNTNTELAQHVPFSVQQLAQAAADSAMQTADLDGDGTISAEEFAQWYASGDIPDVATAIGSMGTVEPDHWAVPAAEAEVVTDIRNVSFISKLSLPELMVIVRQMAPRGTVTREGFHGLLNQLIPVAESRPQVFQDLQTFANRVFDAISQTNSDIAELLPVACALGILCRGVRDEKLQALFHLFNLFSSSDCLSFAELCTVLTSILHTLQVLIADVPERFLPSQASELATQAFADASIGVDELITYPAFHAWIMHPTMVDFRRLLDRVCDTEAQE